MKKRLIRAAIAAGLVIVLFIGQHLEAHAKKAYVEPVTGDPFEEVVKMRCTCYCEHGITASGQKTRYGIVAGKKDWLGCVATLYAINEDGSIGEFIGQFEFKDTGAGMDTDGDGKGDSIKNGQSIDVWIESLDAAYKWRDKYGDYVFIKIIRGEG